MVQLYYGHKAWIISAVLPVENYNYTVIIVPLQSRDKKYNGEDNLWTVRL